jgi:hypothetical protein
VKSKRPLAKSKKESTVIRPEDFPVFLSGVVHAKRKSPKEFAASLGISPQLLYMLLNGKRAPSANVLRNLGLQIAHMIPGYAEIIAPDQLQMLVVLRMQMSKLGQKGYAEFLGIHEQTLYTIVAGIRLPPKSVIKKLELETVYVDASENWSRSK